jgi:DNA polymerase-3 subunit epsilon
VVHFARFEAPFLHALHERYGSGPFPFELVCTHSISRRLFPGLPRCTLRALAGYFGAATPALRRSADHVVATAVVWHHLVDALGSEGIDDLVALREWLTRPTRRPRGSGRSYPLTRERRRELPAGPGIYRLQRGGGTVVYVGKATSLRQRVAGHFHAPAGERALEMLSQVREVSYTETSTALEAALLEADEIKRLAPPYNRALTVAERSLWFANADLHDLRETPDGTHTIGPLASPLPFAALAALRAVLGTDEPLSLAARARAIGVEPAYAPNGECFAAGRAHFISAYGRLSNARAVLHVGARLWADRRAAGAPAPEPAGPVGPPVSPARPAWNADRVLAALEETVIRSAHAVRRARWLVRLSECTITWTEAASSEGSRLLRIERGTVAAGEDVAYGTTTPNPAGASRSAAARRAAFDLAAFDRLRVLTTELRTLATEALSVELRLGLHARLSRRRLQAVLRWV